MALNLPLCRLNRHSPNRGSARWDGLGFISTCVHCKQAIRRREHKVWLREWLDA